MAKAQTTDVFNCTVEQFYKIVTDYEKYPDFLQEVKACKVIKSEASSQQQKTSKKLVEFQISVIKNFKYVLQMTETPHLISWEFSSGDMFKSSIGSWKLEDEAGKCRATYTIEATFTLFVPGPIANALVSVNLPNMISSYHKRVAQLYGK